MIIIKIMILTLETKIKHYTPIFGQSLLEFHTIQSLRYTPLNISTVTVLIFS